MVANLGMAPLTCGPVMTRGAAGHRDPLGTSWGGYRDDEQIGIDSFCAGIGGTA